MATALGSTKSPAARPPIIGPVAAPARENDQRAAEDVYRGGKAQRETDTAEPRTLVNIRARILAAKQKTAAVLIETMALEAKLAAFDGEGARPHRQCPSLEQNGRGKTRSPVQRPALDQIGRDGVKSPVQGQNLRPTSWKETRRTGTRSAGLRKALDKIDEEASGTGTRSAGLREALDPIDGEGRAAPAGCSLL